MSDGSVLEDVNAEIEGRSIANELIQSGQDVSLHIFLPILFSQTFFKLSPILLKISIEELNNFFDSRSAIVRKTNAFLRTFTSSIFAFNIPSIQKFCDVGTIKS